MILNRGLGPFNPKVVFVAYTVKPVNDFAVIRDAVGTTLISLLVFYESSVVDAVMTRRRLHFDEVPKYLVHIVFEPFELEKCVNLERHNELRRGNTARKDTRTVAGKDARHDFGDHGKSVALMTAVFARATEGQHVKFAIFGCVNRIHNGAAVEITDPPRFEF